MYLNPLFLVLIIKDTKLLSYFATLSLCYFVTLLLSTHTSPSTYVLKTHDPRFRDCFARGHKMQCH